MKVNKQALNKKLNSKGIMLSREVLDDVIDIYQYVIDFVSEVEGINSDNRFNFIYSSTNDDIIYFNIFKALIIIREKDLLKYLDYSLLIYSSGFTFNFTFGSLCDYLTKIIKDYNRLGEYFKYYFYDNNPHVIEDVIEYRFDEIISSEYIDNDYKDVIEMFGSIYDKFTENLEELNRIYQDDENSDGAIYFNDFIKAIFHYFIDKNILSDDRDRAYLFLKHIYDDLFGTIDRLNLVGLDWDNPSDYNSVANIFNYIDILYKNFDKKVKVIK